MPSYSLANLLMAFKVVLLDIEETVLKNFSNLSALKSNVSSLPERTTWAVSVVHSKMIFLICYLLDYQQVHDNANVSIILLGDKKEPTK